MKASGKFSKSDMASAKAKRAQKRKTALQLPKKEYSAVCHAIYTKYANKIPQRGNLLYKNHYYMYTYDERTEAILFTGRIQIEGNEELIDALEEMYKP